MLAVVWLAAPPMTTAATWLRFLPLTVTVVVTGVTSVVAYPFLGPVFEGRPEGLPPGVAGRGPDPGPAEGAVLDRARASAP